MGHSSSIFLLNILMLIIPPAFSTIDQDYYLNNTCLGKPSNPDFNGNKVNVLGQIIENAPDVKKRYIAYLRWPLRGDDKNAAYGLAQCHWGITQGDCQNCLNNAAKELANGCPAQRVGIIWHNHCLMKYADTVFSRKMDDIELYYSRNTTLRGSSYLVKAFNQLMVALNANVVGWKSGSFYYTTSSVQWGGTSYLFGMSQCNGDLSWRDCIRCIQHATDFLGTQIVKYQFVGMRAAYVSCSVRYEDFPFF